MLVTSDIVKYLLSIVNHEAWIEVDGRAYLKWGHYPEVDGKLDPMCIVRAFAVSGGAVLPVAVGTDKESSSRGALFLEFEEAEALAVEYDRGIYTLTEDGKWIFGRHVPQKYRVKEKRQILGSAKTYLGDRIEPLGLELELMPDKIGDEVRIQILFGGKPIAGKIKLRNSKGVFEFDAGEEGAVLKLAEGINVISARYVDEGVDFMRSLVTTLTISR